MTTLTTIRNVSDESGRENQNNYRKHIHNLTTNVNTCGRDNRGKSRQVTDIMNNTIIGISREREYIPGYIDTLVLFN